MILQEFIKQSNDPSLYDDTVSLFGTSNKNVTYSATHRNVNLNNIKSNYYDGRDLAVAEPKPGYGPKKD